MPVESVESNSAKLSAFESSANPAEYNKPAYIFMALLVLYVIVRGIRGAAFRPFWFDEIYTLTIAGHTSVREVWNAITAGYDTQGPGFYFLDHFALLIPVKKEVALRLPSIFAFACTLICVFAFVKKRSGEFIACVCALLFLSTSLFHTYLIEARAYGLVFACISFAMVCYQRIPSIKWTVLLALSLAFAGSLHFYALFPMIPFWFAEAAVLLKQRRFRWQAWLALVCGTLPVLACLPLLLALRSSFQPDPWGRPVFSAVRGYYGTQFLLTDNAVGLALVVVAVASILWARVWQGVGEDGGNGQRKTELPEAVLLLSFVALPYIVFILVKVLHGIMLARYVMATTIGIVLGLACALALGGRKATVIFAVFVLAMVLVRESIFWRTPEFDPYMPYFSFTSYDQINKIRTLVEGDGHHELPVVVSDHLLYTQLVYYSDPNFAKRLVCLADEERELHSHGTAIYTRTMLTFRNYFSLQVFDYPEFIAAHKEFLFLVVSGDWYSRVFIEEGASIQPISTSGRLYLVTMKVNSVAERTHGR